MKKGIPQQLNNASDVVGKWESVKASLPDPGKAVLILESDGSWWQGHLDFSGIWQINVRPMAWCDMAWHEAEQVTHWTYVNLPEVESKGAIAQ